LPEDASPGSSAGAAALLSDDYYESDVASDPAAALKSAADVPVDIDPRIPFQEVVENPGIGRSGDRAIR
jgi:hypothetical protein